ncbi:MAG: putative recombination protein [Bacteroidetes bacterium]|nr:putative recombination protein [Bacteroidota bacterium]
MIYKRKKKKEKPLPLFDRMGVTVKKKPDLKAKLDKEFSLFIRLRDAMPNGCFRCISCGHIKPFEQADNGHYINRQHMSTRFDEMNCNAQCRKCNRFMEGNIQNYRKGLIAKYGEQKVILLEAKQGITRKYSDFEYEQLIKYYKALNKKLKKEKEIWN